MTRRDAHRGEPEIVVFGRHAVEDALRSEGAQVLGLAIARGHSAADRKAFRRHAHEFEVVSVGLRDLLAPLCALG